MIMKQQKKQDKGTRQSESLNKAKSQESDVNR